MTKVANSDNPNVVYSQLERGVPPGDKDGEEQEAVFDPVAPATATTSGDVGGRGDGVTKKHDPPATKKHDVLDEDLERDGGAFEYSHGISSAESEKRLVEYGPNELPEKVIPKVSNSFNKCFARAFFDLFFAARSGTSSCRNCGNPCPF